LVKKEFEQGLKRRDILYYITKIKVPDIIFSEFFCA